MEERHWARSCKGNGSLINEKGTDAIYRLIRGWVRENMGFTAPNLRGIIGPEEERSEGGKRYTAARESRWQTRWNK